MVSWKGLTGPLVAVVLILAAGYFVAYPLRDLTSEGPPATQASTSSRPFSVNLAYKSGIGFYLTNGSGFALYFRANDPGNGSSTCYGNCVTAWPLFYAGSGGLNLPSSLSASSFGNATRTDGQKETTFDGYPLYFYVKDAVPGQVNGEGKGNFFACCSIVSVSTTSTTSSGR